MATHIEKHKNSEQFKPCEEYLQKNNIPYNKDIWINNKQVPQIDFIIPGAMIKFQTPSNISRIKIWDKQMSRLSQFVPENIKIYFYCVTMPPSDVIELLEEYPNLTVVDKFDDIKPLL